MEREIIAEIRLAPGEVGYYDDYSRIYLNTSRPTAKIYAGTNTTQIRRSIRSGRLRLVSGSLFVAAPVKTEKPKPVKAEPVKPEEKPEPVPEPEPVFEVPEEAPVEEIVPEEEVPVESAPVEEEKPKRRRSRKKADAE